MLSSRFFAEGVSAGGCRCSRRGGASPPGLPVSMDAAAGSVGAGLCAGPSLVLRRSRSRGGSLPEQRKSVQKRDLSQRGGTESVPYRENRSRLVHSGVRSPRPTEATWGLAGSVGEKATPRYGGRNFILGLQIYILWFILRVRPKISLPGSRARLCGQRGQSRRKAAVFRHFSGDPPGPGTFFPANPEKREDERHESHQAQRHGGGL